jgi:parallel beta-helix repeat protein
VSKARTIFLLLLLVASGTQGAILAVPGDFSTVQAALDAALPGDVVEVAAGTWFEKVEFPSSGTPGQPITLRAAAGVRPILDGSGVSGDNMVLIDSKSHLRLVGFEIRNNLAVNDGSGVRILGSGQDLEIRNNIIHDIRGADAMGITVYGTAGTPIEDLVIDGNEIYDCDPAQSEALTLNGNIRAFAITNNLVRDVNNIGIDMIGGETDIQPDDSLVVREGVVRGNTVLRANANYEGGYAGGIYVDGGRDIVIENNRVFGSDLGIEIGAENSGLSTENIIVRNNIFHGNERAGMVFGGFEAAVGRTRNCIFRGNTLYGNNTLGKTGQGIYFVGGGIGEIWMQFAEDNVIEGNLVYAGVENVFIGSFDPGSSVNNAFDYNLYFSSDLANGEFSLNDTFFTGFSEWQGQTGNGSNSIATDPLLEDPGMADFHLTDSSPAINAGRPAYVPAAGETDLDGGARRIGPAVDLGVDEVGDDGIFSDGFESGDASRWNGAVGL